MRIRTSNKPKYLSEYYLKVDLRKFRSVEKPKSNWKVYRHDQNFEDWKEYLIFLIRMKLDHTVSRNFSVNIGITTPEYINRLFGRHKQLEKKRSNKIKFNSKIFSAPTSNLRFKDPSCFFPFDGYKKIYRNVTNEFIKCELIWVRFKYNTVSKCLSCSGKYNCLIRKNNEWKSI